MIFAPFHFGVWHRIARDLVLRGYNPHTLPTHAWNFDEHSRGWFARTVMKVVAHAEAGRGMHVVRYTPNYTAVQLLRLLRQNQLVIVIADGMMGTDFVDVPFLGGNMAWPTGPLRLAARSGAPVIPCFSFPDGTDPLHVVVHDPIRVPADEPEAIAAAARACVTVLEAHVQQYPWLWWTWRRLELVRDEQGLVRFQGRRRLTGSTQERAG